MFFCKKIRCLFVVKKEQPKKNPTALDYIN